MASRLTLGIALAIAAIGVGAEVGVGADSPKGGPRGFKLGTYRGTVLTLTEALSPLGITFDKPPVEKQVVLLGEDGSITPLLSDDAARAFFLDPRVRNKRTEMQARKYDGLAYLQVVSFKIEDEGRLRTPEYYCDVCSISVRWDQDCPCCQGPLTFRMRPESQ